MMFRTTLILALCCVCLLPPVCGQCAFAPPGNSSAGTCVGDWWNCTLGPTYVDTQYHYYSFCVSTCTIQCLEGFRSIRAAPGVISRLLWYDRTANVTTCSITEDACVRIPTPPPPAVEPSYYDQNQLAILAGSICGGVVLVSLLVWLALVCLRRRRPSSSITPEPAVELEEVVTVAVGTLTPICVAQGHQLHTEFTLGGVLCGVICFPIGILCCCVMRQHRCARCGQAFSN